jgi:hypothetical protein
MSIGVDRVWLAKSLACFHERKKTPQSKAAALEKFRTTETLNIAFLQLLFQRSPYAIPGARTENHLGCHQLPDCEVNLLD